MDFNGFFKKVKIVQEEYWQQVPSGSDREVDIAWLTRVVEKYSDTAISMKVIDWNSDQIKGRIDLYQDKDTGRKYADILTAQKLNYCWMRFVYVKEMCHLIIDTFDSSILHKGPETANETTINLINSLIGLRSGRTIPKEELGGPLMSELLAVNCAIEILFPIKDRLIAAERLKTEEPSSAIIHLAHTYRLPAYYVERSLDAEYLATIGRMALAAEKEIVG